MDRLVTVFGGTGFLGRRIVRHLRAHEFSVRNASRHPDRGRKLFGSENGKLESVLSDIHDDRSVAQACEGAYGAVNAVSLYMEHGGETFRSVHVQAAERVASGAQRAGVKCLVHVSGIGADPASSSPYIRSRGEGEASVRDSFAGAVIVRPAVMFGPDDSFLTTLWNLMRRLPAYPMFGRGHTRLQPVFVEDVGEAVARRLDKAEGDTFECAGPQIYTYAALLETIAREAGLRPILLPMPFFMWHGLGVLGELLPSPLITRSQVELMEVDTICSPHVPGLSDLGISPQSIMPVLQAMLRTAG
jgi:NADH dehydrogenase